MMCMIDILLLMMIEDIKRLWLGGGYYGAPVVLEVTDTMSYRYVMRDHLAASPMYILQSRFRHCFKNLATTHGEDCVTPTHTKHTPRTTSECLKSCFQS